MPMLASFGGGSARSFGMGASAAAEFYIDNVSQGAMTSGSTFNIEYTGATRLITVSSTTTFNLYAWGAGGAGTRRNFSKEGGGGGYSKGTMTLNRGTNYICLVGQRGSYEAVSGIAPPVFGGGGGGAGVSVSAQYDAQGGGGYSGLFIGTVSHANAALIAGGGGSASGAVSKGGGGGGTVGLDAADAATRGGSGGSGSAGGAGWPAGSALQGGTSTSGSGGGGGYYGGGAGKIITRAGAGGGGSSYLSVNITNASTTSGTTGGVAADPDGNKPSGIGDGGANSQSSNGDGYFIFVVV